MIDFSLLSLSDAQAYRDAYIASLPARHEWLSAELTAAALDHREVLRTPHGLKLLWAWANALLSTESKTLRLSTAQPQADAQPGIRPPWYDQSTKDPWLSDDALWLIELLGAHLASAIRGSRTDASWIVYQNVDEPKDVFHHRTLLRLGDSTSVDPSGLVHTAVIGHVLRGKPWSVQQSLASLYDFCVEA